MTCTSSRSCSHSTVSICLVQGRSAIPPLPNLSIAVRSEPFSSPTIVAIFPSFLLDYGGNVTVKHTPHVFWYSSSKTNRFRVFVGDRCASMCCRFIFRQVCAIFRSPSSNVLLYLLHVSQQRVVFVVVVEANVSRLQHYRLK